MDLKLKLKRLPPWKHEAMQPYNCLVATCLAVKDDNINALVSSAEEKKNFLTAARTTWTRIVIQGEGKDRIHSLVKILHDNKFEAQEPFTLSITWAELKSTWDDFMKTQKSKVRIWMILHRNVPFTFRLIKTENKQIKIDWGNDEDWLIEAEIYC